jgi:hypothetical protein
LALVGGAGAGAVSLLVPVALLSGAPASVSERRRCPFAIVGERSLDSHRLIGFVSAGGSLAGAGSARRHVMA